MDKNKVKIISKSRESLYNDYLDIPRMNELDKIIILLLPFLAALSIFLDNKIMLIATLGLSISYLIIRRFF